MKINKVHYALMKAAINKRIQNIYEDPIRGIRNFVDFGEMFAVGKHHKSFLRLFQEELANSESVYYPLIERIIKGTDIELLSTMLVNLGNNSLNLGANHIRAFEKENYHNIPWLLSFDLSRCDPINVQMMEDVIYQGKDLGIMTYSFYLLGCLGELDNLVRILKNEKYCAFIIFIDPEAVTQDLAKEILSSKNIFVAVNIDGEDIASKKEAINILKKNKCLFGGVTSRFESSMQFNELIEEGYSLDLPFIFLWDENKFEPSKDLSEIFFRVRQGVNVPVFPINFFSDIASIDRIISTEACIATISNDGSLRVKNVDGVDFNDEFNVRDITINDIFERVLPKK